MQLPRGTFRSIRKGVKLGEIIEELASSRFTGIGTISSAAGAGTLVYRNGVCILAKYQETYGDGAFQAFLEFPDLTVDVALSDLTGPQLQLALDYNKKAGVSAQRQGDLKPRQPPQSVTATGPVHPRRKQQRSHETREGKEREFIKTTTVAESSPVPPPAVEKTATPPAPVPTDIPPEELAGDTGQSPAEKDLDTFETMDLDDVAQKIRKDCKIILKQLQLDHLTEK